jgi:hypothetical protein
MNLSSQKIQSRFTNLFTKHETADEVFEPSNFECTAPKSGEDQMQIKVKCHEKGLAPGQRGRNREATQFTICRRRGIDTSLKKI